tara:strand:- start:521 stop:727 length:207 start_codon:yes stop_codon:yes gene_type:complete
MITESLIEKAITKIETQFPNQVRTRQNGEAFWDWFYTQERSCGLDAVNEYLDGLPRDRNGFVIMPLSS